MDLVGDAWTPLVLREACYGIRRFDEIQKELEAGISTEQGKALFAVIAQKRTAYLESRAKLQEYLKSSDQPGSWASKPGNWAESILAVMRGLSRAAAAAKASL